MEHLYEDPEALLKQQEEIKCSMVHLSMSPSPKQKPSKSNRQQKMRIKKSNSMELVLDSDVKHGTVFEEKHSGYTKKKMLADPSPLLYPLDPNHLYEDPDKIHRKASRSKGMSPNTRKEMVRPEYNTEPFNSGAKQNDKPRYMKKKAHGGIWDSNPCKDNKVQTMVVPKMSSKPNPSKIEKRSKSMDFMSDCDLKIKTALGEEKSSNEKEVLEEVPAPIPPPRLYLLDAEFVGELKILEVKNVDKLSRKDSVNECHYQPLSLKTNDTSGEYAQITKKAPFTGEVDTSSDCAYVNVGRKGLSTSVSGDGHYVNIKKTTKMVGPSVKEKKHNSIGRK